MFQVNHRSFRKCNSELSPVIELEIQRKYNARSGTKTNKQIKLTERFLQANDSRE